jgi:DNA ligase D-like protein (predicted 3'-phosphoesterase)
VKHLAIATEDHPVDYINFKGTIPQGQYGAGKVEIFDKGKFKLVESTPKSLKFELKGKTLKGKYVLFNLEGKNWLLFKMKK